MWDQTPGFLQGRQAFYQPSYIPRPSFVFFLHHIKTLKVSGILLIVTFIIYFRKLHSLLILFMHLKFKSNSIFHGFSDVFDNWFYLNQLLGFVIFFNFPFYFIYSLCLLHHASQSHPSILNKTKEKKEGKKEGKNLIIDAAVWCSESQGNPLFILFYMQSFIAKNHWPHDRWAMGIALPRS